MKPVVYWEDRVSKKETNKYTISDSSEFYKWAVNPIIKIKAELRQVRIFVVADDTLYTV